MSGLKILLAKETIMGWRKWRARVRKARQAKVIIEDLAKGFPPIREKIIDLTKDVQVHGWLAKFDQLRALLHRQP